MEARYGSTVLCYLLILLGLTSPRQLKADDTEWRIRPDIISPRPRPMDREVGSVVAVGMEAVETDTILHHTGVYMLQGGKWRDIGLDNWRARWFQPGSLTFVLVAEGYRPMRFDTIRIPPDSLVVITVEMEPGSDIVKSVEARARCLSVVYDDLDDLFPRNTISGTVTDDSLDAPVEGVEIYCEELSRRTTTDSLGEFVLPIDTLKRVMLQVWHPLYDSIRFEVGKDYVRTEKPIEVHFDCCRASGPERLRCSDSSALLIVTWHNWGYHTSEPIEHKYWIYTYAVKGGQIFGPTSRWVGGECMPFRLVRTFKERRAWVQFVEDLDYIGEKTFLTTNFFDVSDSAAKLGTKTIDAGTTVSLQLQPDYSPRGVVCKSSRDRLRDSRRKVPKERTVCDSIRAEVERVHLQNFLYMLNRDLENLVAAFSSVFRVRTDPFTPSVEYFERRMTPERMSKQLRYRLAELCDFRRAEVYVHGICDETMNDRFLKIMDRVKCDPEPGDVLVVFKEGPRSPWHGGWTSVYRKENGRWKILTSE